MAIQFDCPACGKKTQAPDDMAGQAARCPLCQAVIEVPLPGYGTGEAPGASPPAPPPKAKVSEDEGRKPCPMCGEMILEDAAKCRYCGEILDEELRKTQKKVSSADADMTPSDYIIAVIPCFSIGCIVGIIWMIQGKPKGLKVFLIAVVANIFWGIIIAAMQNANH